MPRFEDPCWSNASDVFIHHRTWSRTGHVHAYTSIDIAADRGTSIPTSWWSRGWSMFIHHNNDTDGTRSYFMTPWQCRGRGTLMYHDNAANGACSFIRNMPQMQEVYDHIRQAIYAPRQCRWKDLFNMSISQDDAAVGICSIVHTSCQCCG